MFLIPPPLTFIIPCSVTSKCGFSIWDKIVGSVCKGEIGSPVISKSSYHSWEITSGTEADVITCVLLSGKTSKGSRRGAYDRYKNVESQASGLEIMPLNTPGAPQKQPGNALKFEHKILNWVSWLS